MSDREIVQQSVLCTGDLLEKGDSVMADCGFNSFNIDDLLAPEGVPLNIPPVLDGQPQQTRKSREHLENCRIAYPCEKGYWASKTLQNS